MTQATSISTLWDALYAWVSGVLEGVPVIEAYQNAPAPAGNYIAIDYSGSWRLAETTSDLQPRTGDEGEYMGTRVYTYRGSVQVRDVCGDGDNLLRLMESLNSPDLLNDLSGAGFSVLRSSGPVQVPALEQSEWRRESVLTLELAWARGYAGTTLVMQSVDIERVDTFGTIDAQDDLVVDDGNCVLTSEELKNKLTIEAQEAAHGT